MLKLWMLRHSHEVISRILKHREEGDERLEVGAAERRDYGVQVAIRMSARGRILSSNSSRGPHGQDAPHGHDTPAGGISTGEKPLVCLSVCQVALIRPLDGHMPVVVFRMRLCSSGQNCE